MIYTIKHEWMFRNKVNSSLVSTWNWKMGYWRSLRAHFWHKVLICVLCCLGVQKGIFLPKIWPQIANLDIQSINAYLYALYNVQTGVEL